jgi:quercetin dioxygenase-like cupin family protein
MDQPDIKIGCVANLFSRMMHFKAAGDKEIGHTHPFDHLTLLASGRLQVTVDGQVSEFAAPHMVYIKADKVHELVALEDGTVAYCIHALRDGNGVDDILDPAMIPKGVNALAVARPVVNNGAM